MRPSGNARSRCAPPEGCSPRRSPSGGTKRWTVSDVGFAGATPRLGGSPQYAPRRYGPSAPPGQQHACRRRSTRSAASTPAFAGWWRSGSPASTQAPGPSLLGIPRHPLRSAGRSHRGGCPALRAKYTACVTLRLGRSPVTVGPGVWRAMIPWVARRGCAAGDLPSSPAVCRTATVHGVEAAAGGGCSAAVVRRLSGRRPLSTGPAPHRNPRPSASGSGWARPSVGRPTQAGPLAGMPAEFCGWVAPQVRVAMGPRARTGGSGVCGEGVRRCPSRAWTVGWG